MAENHLSTEHQSHPNAYCGASHSTQLLTREAFDAQVAAGTACLACVRTLERDAVQAQLDALMLEYCPEDMTPEQRKTWAAHQRPDTSLPDFKVSCDA